MVGRATKRGRPRKPEHKRQGHRVLSGTVLTAQDRSLETVEAPIPEPPTRLDGGQLADAALLAWDRFWLSDLRGALDGTDGVDRIQVDRWARLLDEHETLWAEVQAERIVSGSKGQPRLNPLHMALAATRKDLERQEGVLGLTPADRARLGITFASAAVLGLHAALLQDDAPS